MQKIDTIYVDMDGVLVDFEKTYKQWFGELYKNEETWQRNREILIARKGYEVFDLKENADTLISHLDCMQTIGEIESVQILSATGGSRDKRIHEEVMRQKNVWLDKHNIHWPRNFVGSGREKGKFATEYTLLIDDTGKCLDSFWTAGGNIIAFNDVFETIRILHAICRGI